MAFVIYSLSMVRLQRFMADSYKSQRGKGANKELGTNAQRK